MGRRQQILKIEQLAIFPTVPKFTVYKLVRKGRIPGRRVARRVGREAILRWMEGSSALIG